jgi:hypothetical protein
MGLRFGVGGLPQARSGDAFRYGEWKVLDLGFTPQDFAAAS